MKKTVTTHARLTLAKPLRDRMELPPATDLEAGTYREGEHSVRVELRPTLTEKPADDAASSRQHDGPVPVRRG